MNTFKYGDRVIVRRLPDPTWAGVVVESNPSYAKVVDMDGKVWIVHVRCLSLNPA